MEFLVESLLLIAVLIAASKGAGALSSKVGQPAVLGELLAGLLLGPSLLGLIHFFPSPEVLETERQVLEIIVKDLAKFGVIFLMFLAGLETELEEMKKVGLAAVNGATGGVVFPFVFGFALSRAFGFGLTDSLFIGTILTATSVSISAQTLMELGQLRSKEGTTILGAAIIDDVMGIILLSFVVALTARVRDGTAEGISLLVSFGAIILKMALFLAVSIAVGSYVLKRVAKRLGVLPASEVVLAFGIVVVLVYSWGAEVLGGVADITGAYIAGLIFAGTPIKHIMEEKMKTLAYGFFVPVFFVNIGLEANIFGLEGFFLYTAVVTVGAILTKIIGSGLGVWLTQFTAMESLRVGTGMVSRGEVALIITNVGLDRGVIGREVFSMMVIMTLITTMITPILLRLEFPRKKPGKGRIELEPELEGSR